jgi:hypothetical protein
MVDLKDQEHGLLPPIQELASDGSGTKPTMGMAHAAQPLPPNGSSQRQCRRCDGISNFTCPHEITIRFVLAGGDV